MSEIGRWITNGTAAPFYARRLFSLEKKVKKAEAKVCGLGQFVFWVNGCKVDDHELDPGWTDYKKLVEYVVFDVTESLHTGENVIGAEVGNGWFIKMDEHYTFSFPPFMPPNPNPYQPYGKSLMLAAELSIMFEDGTQMCLNADEDWRVQRHLVVMSNVYGSETIDGRLAPQPEGIWSTAGFDDSGWKRAVYVPDEEAPAGKLIQQAHPPVKVIHTYEGVYLGKICRNTVSVDGIQAQTEAVREETAHEKTVPEEKAPEKAAPEKRTPEKAASEKTAPETRAIYDFGQNLSGILEFEVKGHVGDVVKVYPAEKLGADGDVDQMAKNWVNLDSCETYIIGTEEKWERFRMKFTYFAGRFVAVERIPGGGLKAPSETPVGAEKAQSERPVAAKTEQGGIELRHLVAHAITSAWKTDGSFICDDERYNQIYNMIEKTVEANMTTGVHTDCPTIERFTWQEPNHLMASSIMFMKDGRHLWGKFLLDMRAGQHTADDWFFDMQGGKFYPGAGLMPSQCPCYIPNVLPTPGMGSFYDIIAWGSTCILGTYWHYQFYGDPQIIEDNYDAGMRYLDHLKTKVTADGFINHGLGDWGNPRNELVKENVETAFLYADAMTLAYFAEVLEQTSSRAAISSAKGQNCRQDCHAVGCTSEEGASDYDCSEPEGKLRQSHSATAGNETEEQNETAAQNAAKDQNETAAQNAAKDQNETAARNAAKEQNTAKEQNAARKRNLTKDRGELLAFAGRIKDNYNKKLLTWNEERGFWCYRAWDHPDELFMTQATEALPLYWGLVPEDKEADVARALRYVLEQDGALISGEVGLPYVIQSARKYGMNDIISRFILKKEHPSYYAFILDGETTLGEYWETNPRSHCHDMMGHIIEWYYNGIAGILCEEPGFAKVTIRPYLPESMNEFTCSYQSVKGLIQVKVARIGKAAGHTESAAESGGQTAGQFVSENAGNILLTVTVPEQVDCTIDTCNLESRGDTVEINRQCKCERLSCRRSET